MSLLRHFLLQGGASGDLADVATPSHDATVAGWATKGLRVLLGRTDRVANLPVLLDYDHHQVHAGQAFRWSTFVAALANGQSKDLRIVVPSISIPSGNSAVGLCPHLRCQVVCSGDARVYLHEGTTFTAAGNSRTPIAHERNGSYTPKLQIFEDPTIDVLGSLLWQGLTLAASPKAGSTEDSAAEFVLKNNTEYSFRVSSLAAAAKVLIRVVWHEEA